MRSTIRGECLPEARQTGPARCAGLLLFLLLSASLLVWRPSAQAQISPGPLARAHSTLNGTANCTTCHKISAGQATYRCVECHTEIGSRVNNHHGLHATYNMKPGSSQECIKCHSDHNGEDFPLVKWDVNTFDHRTTGYVLEGKHAGLACNKCHTAERVAPSERATIKVKDLNKTFLGIPQACVPCHEDYHKGRLGPNCLQCHNYEDWKVFTIPGGKFDHSKTRYPLTGLHAKVACEKCHTPGANGKPRYVGIPFEKCDDCHEDPHKGSFTQTCQSCHNTNGWKKVSTPALNENFDHSKTKYPLLGKHATVECIACHANADFKKHVVFAKCMDCHQPDPHGGQFVKRAAGECAPCHTVDGFKPSTFGVKEHATSAYPLEGGHAKVECDQCHIPKGKDTQYKIKFKLCTDCHKDEHGGQFALAPYLNACEKCHDLEGYRPSTFTIARHKNTRFILTGGHIAVPCGDCHKESEQFKPKTELYHWQDLACTSCHQDPHKGQFDERMRQPGPNGTPAGCELCHSTKAWKELSRFDHSKTSFPLVGAHRATACIDCHKPPNLETNLTNVDFKVAPTKCEDCHEDVHGKQFVKKDATPCADCHNSTKWKPSTFDHDKSTTFPLEGEHRNVRCEDCHKLTRLVEGKTVLFYKPTPKECAACHGATVKPLSSEKE
jgi:hypothetical protein